MSKLSRRVRCHILLLACLASNAFAEVPAYAPVKARICGECAVTVPAEMMPVRGVVISQGAFGTPVGYWSAVDLDRRSMTRFITQLNNPTEKPALVQSRTVQLSDDDLAVIVPLMNAVWSLPEALPLQRTTDAVWALELFDAGVRRKEYGMGVIQAQGAELNNVLDAIWRRLAR
jgi:hypothetical protein